MTKQQKEIAKLERENKKLKRDNFLLKGRVKELERQVFIWKKTEQNSIDKTKKPKHGKNKYEDAMPLGAVDQGGWQPGE